MDETWIRLYRKTTDSQVFKNEGLLKVWVWSLLKATYKKRWVSVKAGKSILEVELQPGQFIFGRKSAAKILNMSPSTIWKRMQKLKTMRNCDIDSNTNYSIITILNWDTYQPEKIEGDTDSDSRVTAKGQPSDTNKKVKNIKKDNKTNLKKYLQEKIIKENYTEHENKIIEFFGYRQAMPVKEKYKSDKGINGLFRDLNNCKEKGYDISECLEITMENGWLTPRPDYFKNILKDDGNYELKRMLRAIEGNE